MFQMHWSGMTNESVLKHEINVNANHFQYKLTTCNKQKGKQRRIKWRKYSFYSVDSVVYLYVCSVG